jgi:hypothetical protein
VEQLERKGTKRKGPERMFMQVKSIEEINANPREPQLAQQLHSSPCISNNSMRILPQQACVMG